MTGANLVRLALTLAGAALAGFLFMKRRVPGGMLVGAIVGAAVVNIGLGMGYLPKSFKMAAQLTAGAFIGAMVSRDDLKKIRSIYRVAGVVIASFLVLNLTVGFILYLLSPFDLLTCLMCTIPGGMSDVPLIAADMGADVAPIVIVHFVRTVVGLGVFPSAIVLLTKAERQPGEELRTKRAAAAQTAWMSGNIFITLLLATAFGVFGKAIGIPAGALVFSMAGIAAVKLCGFDAQIPRWIKRVAQTLSGAYIGCSISKESLLGCRYVLLPMLIVLAAYILNAWAIGNLISKKFGIPRKEALLTMTPAGAGEMALISQDIGVNSPSLILIHILRLFVSDAILPQLCYLLVKLTGL